MKNLHLPDRSLPEKKHSLQEILYSFTVILPVAFLFTLKNDLPHVFIITFLLLLLPLFVKKPLAAADRPVIYCITAGIVLTALPDLMIGQDDARIGLFDVLVRSTLVLPFLVYTAALGGLFASSGRINGARAALVAGGMLLCGDRFNSRDVHNVFLSFLDPLLHHYFLVYIVCAIWLGIFLPCFIRAGSGKRERFEKNDVWNNKKGKRNYFLLQAVSIILFALFVFFAASFVQHNSAFLRSVEMYFMRWGARSLKSGRNTKSMLSRKVDLRAPLPPYFGQLPDRILFRVKAGFPPGLLRSSVYSHYDNGRWFTASVSSSADTGKGTLVKVSRTGILSFSSFRLPSEESENTLADPENDLPNEKKENAILFFPDSLILSGLIPMPGNTIRIDAVADSAEVNNAGILKLKHWKKDGGITFFVREPDPEAAYNPFLQKDHRTQKGIYGEKLSPVDRRNLTQIPEWVSGYMKKAFAGRLHNDLSGRRKMERIREHLIKNCSYSLYVPPPARKEFFKDPVLRFLEDTKKGHCELFASAAVLLCRGAGLPARYVTGFVCEEKSPVGNYYYCRLAHAWGEVWLPEEGKWVTLDAALMTEEFSMVTGQKRNMLKCLLDFLKYKGQEIFAAIRRGYFAEGILNLFLSLWEFLLYAGGTPAGIIFWIVCSGILAYFLYRKYVGKRTDTGHGRKEIILLQQKFRIFEKRFSRITGRKREKNIPAGVFYRSFSLPELTQYMKKYEILRFGNLEKAEFTVIFSAWEEEMTEILQNLKKKDPAGKE